MAFNLLNAKSNQFGAGAAVAGFLFPRRWHARLYPDPQRALAQLGPLVITDPGKFTDNQFTANWDREFRGGKDRLSERFFWSNSDTFEPFGADSYGIQTGGLPGYQQPELPLGYSSAQPLRQHHRNSRVQQ